MYKRIILKLSGEALGSKDNVFDVKAMDSIAKQIKSVVSNGTAVGVVVGGGNLVRGKAFEKLGFDRVDADHIGMLGTTLNAMVLAGALRKNKQKAVAMSATYVDGVEALDIKKANELLKNGTVVVFGGGIANPYFTTDTACALRAVETKAEAVFMAKNGTDGVYDSDPNINPKAKRFDELTFDDILEKNLQVIDQTSASLMRDNGINAFVFDMNAKDNIKKAVCKKAVGTLIKAK